MCVIFWRVDDTEQATPYRFVLLANRDEFFARPAVPAHFWERETVLAGKDVLKGGTWLGITKTGRFAAVTNLRTDLKLSELSRGTLVAEYLEGDSSPSQFAAELSAKGSDYGGFNLVLADLRLGKPVEMAYCTNCKDVEKVQDLRSGTCYGLCNEWLEHPTKKLLYGKDRLQNLIQKNAPKDELIKQMLALAADETSHFPDDKIPALPAFFPKEWRQWSSSLFIKGVHRKGEPESAYGTRTTTVILVEKNGHVTFVEKTLEEPIVIGEYKWKICRHEFELQEKAAHL